MSYQVAVFEHVFIVRWDTPTPDDVERILRHQAGVATAQSRKIIFLAITPPESKPPDERTRQAFAKAMARLFDNCGHLYMAFEGAGFPATIKRSALTGIILLSGQRGRVTVVDTVDQAVIHATEPDRSILKQAIRLAAAQGIPIESLEVATPRNLKILDPQYGGARR